MTESNPELKIKPLSDNAKILICFCDGNKGGVGKSFFCRTLYHVLKTSGLSIKGLEADINSPDFAGIYGAEIEPIQFSEDEQKLDLPNAIFDIALEEKQNIVVNLPATVHEAFRRWVEAYNVISLLARNDCKLVKFFVTTGEFDSIQSLKVSLNQFPEIQHVIVKNQKYSDWDFFETEKEVQQLIQKSNSPVIELPRLPVRIASFLLQKRMSFAAALEYRGDRAAGERYGLPEREAVRSFLEKAAQHIFQSGVF